MLSGHRSAGRRRNSRAARIAVPLAIPMALGLTLGIILAVSAAITPRRLSNRPWARAPRPRPAPRPQRRAGARRPRRRAPRPPRPAPRPRVPAPRRRQPRPLRHRARRHPAHRRRPRPPSRAFRPSTPRAVPAWPVRMRWTRPATRSASPRPQAEAADSTNCTVTVPANPLTAQGLATPWELGGRLHLGQRRHRGRVHRRHDPVAERPAPGVQPAGDQPGHHAGGGAGGADDRAGLAGHPQRRVQRRRAGPGGPRARGRATASTRLGNSLVDQTPQCNAANFYRMANFEIARGLLKIPAAGTGKDGQACQTTP